MAIETVKYSFHSAIRGYQIYKHVWMPCEGQHLVGEREQGNAENSLAFVVIERDGQQT